MAPSGGKVFIHAHDDLPAEVDLQPLRDELDRVAGQLTNGDTHVYVTTIGPGSFAACEAELAAVMAGVDETTIGCVEMVMIDIGKEGSIAAFAGDTRLIAHGIVRSHQLRFRRLRHICPPWNPDAHA